MSQLMDVLTKKSVEDMYAAFQEGVLKVMEKGHESAGFNRKNFQEVGPPLLVYVHGQAIAEAQHLPHEAPNRAFPYRIRGIRHILEREGVTGMTLDRLSAEISRMLVVNGMAIRPAKRGVLWLRPGPWPAQLTYVPLRPPEKQDWRTEQRIAEEAAKPAPVVVHHNLRQITLPDPNPESVMDFIARFITAALKVEAELTATKSRVLELENQVAALIEEAEAKAEDTSAWNGVTTKLAEVMAGAGVEVTE